MDVSEKEFLEDAWNTLGFPLLSNMSYKEFLKLGVPRLYMAVAEENEEDRVDDILKPFLTEKKLDDINILLPSLTKPWWHNFCNDIFIFVCKKIQEKYHDEAPNILGDKSFAEFIITKDEATKIFNEFYTGLVFLTPEQIFNGKYKDGVKILRKIRSIFHKIGIEYTEDEINDCIFKKYSVRRSEMEETIKSLNAVKVVGTKKIPYIIGMSSLAPDKKYDKECYVDPADSKKWRSCMMLAKFSSCKSDSDSGLYADAVWANIPDRNSIVLYVSNNKTQFAGLPGYSFDNMLSRVVLRAYQTPNYMLSCECEKHILYAEYESNLKEKEKYISCKSPCNSKYSPEWNMVLTYLNDKDKEELSSKRDITVFKRRKDGRLEDTNFIIKPNIGGYINYTSSCAIDNPSNTNFLEDIIWLNKKANDEVEVYGTSCGSLKRFIKDIKEKDIWKHQKMNFPKTPKGKPFTIHYDNKTYGIYKDGGAIDKNKGIVIIDHKNCIYVFIKDYKDNSNKKINVFYFDYQPEDKDGSIVMSIKCNKCKRALVRYNEIFINKEVPLYFNTVSAVVDEDNFRVREIKKEPEKVVMIDRFYPNTFYASIVIDFVREICKKNKIRLIWLEDYDGSQKDGGIELESRIPLQHKDEDCDIWQYYNLVSPSVTPTLRRHPATYQLCLDAFDISEKTGWKNVNLTDVEFDDKKNISFGPDGCQIGHLYDRGGSLLFPYFDNGGFDCIRLNTGDDGNYFLSVCLSCFAYDEDVKTVVLDSDQLNYEISMIGDVF
jgi:hypothetical protein